MIIPAAPARSINPRRRSEKIKNRSWQALRQQKRTPPARQGPRRRRWWFPVRQGSKRIDRLLAGQDLGYVLGDGPDVLRLELALLVGVVGLHLSLVVEDDGDVRFLGDVVASGAGGVVKGEDGVLEPFLLGEVLELFLHALVITEENNEAAHAGGLVLG